MMTFFVLKKKAVYDCFDTVFEHACHPVNNSAELFDTGEPHAEPAKPKPVPKKKKKYSHYQGMQYDPAANTSCPAAGVTRGFQAIRTCTYYPVRYRKCFFVPYNTTNITGCDSSPYFPNKKHI